MMTSVSRSQSTYALMYLIEISLEHKLDTRKYRSGKRTGRGTESRGVRWPIFSFFSRAEFPWSGYIPNNKPQERTKISTHSILSYLILSIILFYSILFYSILFDSILLSYYVIKPPSSKLRRMTVSFTALKTTLTLSLSVAHVI